ncbi:hypothetical protein OO009_01125 [Flavobacteriaceae bacterium KMM 6897]|nr:hypothetical protein [Flavobacteriaceae bacterium KMM 6897]
MKQITLLLMVLVLGGCGGKDAPKAPESSRLVFPLKDSECTTGVSLTNTTSEVEFQWQASDNTETYQIRLTNLLTNVSQNMSTSATAIKLPLDKGAPYSWFITSKNTNVTETATSEIWRFYNSGFQTSYAPFPADIIAPKSGASVLKSANNEVELDWSGADVDNDIIGYEVYFSTNNPPETLVFSPQFNDTDVNVTVVANTVYYWSVKTLDSEGNTSDSGVYQFKSL